MDYERKAEIRRHVTPGAVTAGLLDGSLDRGPVIRELLDALEAAESRLRYYENALCIPDHPIALEGGAVTGAIQPEKVGALVDDRDLMREALLRAEWAYDLRGAFCPACGKPRQEGHRSSCIVGKALRRPECGGGA